MAKNLCAKVFLASTLILSLSFVFDLTVYEFPTYTFGNLGNNHIIEQIWSQTNNTLQRNIYTTDFKIKVIRWIENKLNYTEYANIERIQKFKLKDYIQNIPPNVDCMDNITTNSQCQLSNNVSLIIYDELGSGVMSDAYNVTIMYNQHKFDHVVMKQFYVGNQTNLLYINNTCVIYEREYKLLKQMEDYAKYLNLSSINIPLLLKNMTLYHSTNYCIMFMQQVPNGISLHDLLHNASTFLPSIIDIKGNIIHFAVDCYNDIMKVMRLLHKFRVFHNDVTKHNILVNTKTFQCYVIDFGNIWEQRGIFNLEHSAAKLYFQCVYSTCPPVTYYFLRTFRQRKQFIEIVGKHHLRQWSIAKKKGVQLRKPKGNATLISKRKLSKVAIYAKKYEITSLVFHSFVRLLGIQTQQENQRLFQLNEAIFHPHGRTKRIFQNDTEIIWCVRYQLYHKIIGKIDDINYNKPFGGEMDDWMSILSIFEGDSLFLNLHKCNFTI